MSGVSRQAGKAALAAATAASTSVAPPRGTRPITWPVAGLKTGPVCSGRTSTGRPSIQWLRMGSVAGCASSMVMVPVSLWLAGAMGYAILMSGSGRTRSRIAPWRS